MSNYIFKYHQLNYLYNNEKKYFLYNENLYVYKRISIEYIKFL